MSVKLDPNVHVFETALGVDVEDTITGFKGVVTALTTYLTGCDRYAVTPRELKDGRPQDPCYLEGYRLRVQTHTDGVVVDHTKSQTICFEFQAGEYVKDVVTGFIGVVVARTASTKADNRYALVHPNPKNMKDDREWLYFDETQLQHTKKAVIELEPTRSGKPGGPVAMEAPRR